MQNKSDIEDMKFEVALAELEKAAESLRSGRLELEESILVYDKCIMLHSHCAKLLENATQKIEIYNPENGSKEDFEA